jgi:Flp pilus assembly protein TadG
MPKFSIATIWSDNRGTTAVEYALVAPVFIGVVVSAFYFYMALFLVGSLHYAVEEGARCASVKTTVCSDSTTTISYTQSHYFGPAVSPTFTYNANLACGNSVSASVSFVANLGLQTVTIPVTASACFP